ncbi:MAG TPA: NAD(P)/FAD-dependent oxidoreductase [Steroidobacteraceae bacterium]|nr:NAD(P)/FAD-dependent oxidoreductase [Steroidobacteraceae bacterium]
MDNVSAVVIGAGVVGLAVARALAARGHETLILEAGGRFGEGASSRNSEVIHAGIYYRTGSLKARLCVTGRDQLYEFCRIRGVPHQRCGKLIVATDGGQVPGLREIAATARANGVELELLTAAAARAMEPALACEAALHSPHTGILDSHAYMLALLADAEHHGASLVCGNAVTRLGVEDRGITIGVNGAEPTVRARRVVNCAGVHAPAVARLIDGFPARHIPQAYFAKGSYFTLRGESPFRRLIYPLPIPGGLGIHLTLDLAGRARFGPDVQWVEACEYNVDAQRGLGFYDAVRRYWPGLRDGALQPGYAGVRAKISGPAEPAADFRIDDATVHGVPGLVNLFGIESPGLTASLALASEAVSRIS